MHTFCTRCSSPLAEEPAEIPVRQDSGEKRSGPPKSQLMAGRSDYFPVHAPLKERFMKHVYTLK